MLGARASGSLANRSHRSWCRCRLWLVVRYVESDCRLAAWGKETHRWMLTFAGYHVPAVRHRDAFYQKLEDERAASLGQK